MANGKKSERNPDISELPKFRCRVLYSDSSGRFWLGFENGEVAVYEKGVFRVFSKKDGLPSGKVLVITGDSAGKIWIGGESGLSRFDNGRFSTIKMESGLPGNSVSGIIEDDAGFLWVAGSLAIFRVSLQELEKAFKDSTHKLQGISFDASDGLRGLPRQREPFPTATRGSDGRLWFATTGGIAVIDPKIGIEIKCRLQ